MLIFLLISEILIAFIIILSHKMLKIKYAEIEKSTHIYMDKRAYRTQRSILFIDGITKRYLEYIKQQGELPDLYSMIKSSLLKEYIGKFPLTAVNNVAHKSKHIMWGVIILEMVIAYINNVAMSLEGIVVIISSILLTIAIEIFIIISSLEEKKEITIVIIEDYILNAYPLQASKVDKSDIAHKEKMLSEESSIEESPAQKAPIEKQPKKEIALLNQEKKQDSTISNRQRTDNNEENNKKEEVNDKTRLTEKDIASFIKHLNKI